MRQNEHDSRGDLGRTPSESDSALALVVDGDPTDDRTLTQREQRQREQAAVKHGLFVKSQHGRGLRDRRTRRLLAKVRDQMPWLQPSDIPAARAWCQLEVLCTQCFNHFSRGDEMSERSLDVYRRLRQTQLQFANALGMTPAARADLGLTVKQTEALDDYVARRYGRPSEVAVDAVLAAEENGR